MRARERETESKNQGARGRRGGVGGADRRTEMGGRRERRG